MLGGYLARLVDTLGRRNNLGIGPGRSVSPRASLLSGLRIAIIALAFVAGAVACSRLDDTAPVATASLPLELDWQSTTINNPTSVPDCLQHTPAGSWSHDAGAGTFTLSSDGRGVHYHGLDACRTWDEGQFTYVDASGDVEIVARVVSFEGARSAQAGLLIRASATDAYAEMGGGLLVLGRTGDCNTSTFDHCPGWPVQCDVGCDASAGPNPVGMNEIVVAGRFDDPRTNQLAVNMGGSGSRVNAPFWLRLQRVGDDFYASRALDNGETPGPWIPLSNASGGAFDSDEAVVGLFVSGTSEQFSTATAIFDHVYVGPPRLDHRTSWVGARQGSNSAGYLSSGTHGFYVSPDGISYKYATETEQGHSIDKIAPDGGLISRFGLGDGLPNGITGDGENIYVAQRLNSSDTALSEKTLCRGPYVVNRLSAEGFDGNASFAGHDGSALGMVAGMAVGDGRLFVTDSEKNGVWILDAEDLGFEDYFDLDVPDGGPHEHVGPLAIDHDGNLWIIRRQGDEPTCNSSYDFGDGTETSSRIECWTQEGERCTLGDSQITISDVKNPIGIAIAPNPENPSFDDAGAADRLLVVENGPDQNVRVYQNITTSPTLDTTFGPDGGALAGPTPGVTTGHDNRFFRPLGVGVDADGDLYVASSSPNVDIRKFAADGGTWNAAADWGLAGLHEPGTFAATPDGGVDFYTITQRYSLNLANSEPGTEWQRRAVTWNPFRTSNNPVPTRDDQRGKDHSPVMRRIGDDLFMFVRNADLGRAPPTGSLPVDSEGRVTSRTLLRIYRFENGGEIAIPAGAITLGSGGVCEEGDCCQNGNCLEIWTDRDGDGVEESDDEFSTIPSQGGPLVPSVDDVGTVWFVSGLSILELRHEMVNGVPSYSLAESVAVPSALAGATEVRYHDSSRTMYIVGWNAESFVETPTCNPCRNSCFGGRAVVARVEGWRDGGTNTFTRELPDPRDSKTVADNFVLRQADPQCSGVGMAGRGYPAFDLAGDMFFLGSMEGPIYVHSRHGSMPELTRLYAGPEASGIQNWLDGPRNRMQAFQAPNGEYLVTNFSQADRARTLFFRWKPGDLGEECSGPNHCASGHCVDGICCATACGPDTQCISYQCANLGGTPGFCAGLIHVDAECDDGDSNTISDVCQEHGECAGVRTAASLSPLAWFVASEQDVVLSNGAVSEWLDRTGNGFDVGNYLESGRPTYNATGWNGEKPTITFNGFQLLRRLSWPSGAPEGNEEAFTVLAVVRVGAVHDGSVVAWWSSQGIGAVRASVINSSGNAFLELARDDDLWGTQSHSAQIVTGPHFVAWRYSPGVLKVTIDGTTHTSSAPAIGEISLNTFLIGARSDLPTWLFRGDISELVVVAASISDSDVDDFRAYAQSEWEGLP